MQASGYSETQTPTSATTEPKPRQSELAQQQGKRRTVKQLRLACALFRQGLVEQPAHPGTLSADVPALGYLPQSMG